MGKDVKVDRSARNKKRRHKGLILNTLYLVIIAFISVILYFAISSNKKELRELGIEQYEAGSYEEAYEYFTDALIENQIFSSKMDADIIMYKGECLIKLNRYEEAYNLYSKLTTEYNSRYYDKDNVDFLMRLCTALDLFYQGSYDDLLVTFDEAISKGYNEMCLHAAICCEQKGDYVGMINYFDKYQEYFSINQLICYKASSYYLNNEQPDMAIAYIDTAKTFSSNIYIKEMSLNEIIYYEKVMNFDKAYELVQIYIANYPDDKNGKNEYEFLKTRVELTVAPVEPNDITVEHME